MDTLTDIAKEEIERLARDGIAVTPQQVLDIQALSLACTGHDPECGSIARGRIAVSGALTLYSPTIASTAYYRDVAPLASTDEEQIAVCVYAYAHARDNSIYGRGRAAVTQAVEWYRRLMMTEEEILDALAMITRDIPVAVPDPEAPDALGELSLLASSLCGGSPESWETQCSLRAVARVIDIAISQRLANGSQPRHDARIEAVRTLGRYVEQIAAEAHKTEEASDGSAGS